MSQITQCPRLPEFTLLLSRIRSVAFRPIATRGHSLTTWTLALHYCWMSPKTTFPIIHCTDVTHTAVRTDHAHTWESSHNYTAYLNLGLPLALCWVLFSIATLQSIPICQFALLVFPCLIPARVFWIYPYSLALWTLFASRLDYCSYTWTISLPSPW